MQMEDSLWGSLVFGATKENTSHTRDETLHIDEQTTLSHARMLCSHGNPTSCFLKGINEILTLVFCRDFVNEHWFVFRY